MAHDGQRQNSGTERVHVLGKSDRLFVVSENLGGATVEAVTIGDTFCKPHRGVRLCIKSRPRKMVVRPLKRWEHWKLNCPLGRRRRCAMTTVS